MRLLVLCTHNSARSQMAEGWLRYYAQLSQRDIDIHSAGSEASYVKAEAIIVMQEVGIDISKQFSKSLEDLPDMWNFHLVLTVCDNANEHCPHYPAKTLRLHQSFNDPSGESLDTWRKVRDDIGAYCKRLIVELV